MNHRLVSSAHIRKIYPEIKKKTIKICFETLEHIQNYIYLKKNYAK